MGSVNDPRRACIYVFAGVNGAGKSSLAGPVVQGGGVSFFDPDRWTQRLTQVVPGLTEDLANKAAWRMMKEGLEGAIRDRKPFAFETTLGGNTIAGLLGAALDAGIDVRVWYVGLDSVELHIQRVRARVNRGGHAVPEDTIRKRYDRSRWNLIELLPRLTELFLYDNTEHADPAEGNEPHPHLVLHMLDGSIVDCDFAVVPTWAQPIVRAAVRITDG
jgi:predicted ABC-type ATPase